MKQMTLKDTLNSIELIVFDIDGTLVISHADWDGMRTKLRDHFKRNYDINLEFRPVLDKMEEAIEIIQKKNPQIDSQKIKDTVMQIIEETGLEGIKKSQLVKNCKKNLEKLRKKRKRLASFTRSGLKEASLALQLHNIEKYFEMVVTRDDTARVKPNPDPILLISKKMNINPDNILVVGDHPYDILAGKRAGTKTIGVLSGIAPKEDLLKAGADFILESIAEIEKYL
jgi:HAD superfamily hydrolase (TIGR01549 family)